MRNPVLTASLAVALTAPGAGAVSAQDWPRLPLVQISAADTAVVELPGVPDTPGYRLQLSFLKTGAAPPSSAFGDAPDSLTIRASRDGRSPWQPIGGIALPPFVTAYQVGDFDLDGRIDLFLEWFTGGNGAASSGGAIYEIGPWDDDAWYVREKFHSDTSVSVLDLDRDGLWEFAIADEYWGLATAHAWAARYYSRIYRPDTQRGGYELANEELSSALQRMGRPANLRRLELIHRYEENPDPELARDVAAAWGESVAWYIAQLNESSLRRWLEIRRELLDQLIRDLGLPVGDVEGLLTDALEQMARIRELEAYPPPGLDEGAMDDIREAVIRHMVRTHNGWPGEAEGIVVAVSDQAALTPGRVLFQDPSPELAARLADLGKPLFPASSTEIRRDPTILGLFVTGSDTRVIQYEAGLIRYQSPDWVTVDATYYWGPRAAGGWTFTLHREGGKWKVVGTRMHWIS